MGYWALFYKLLLSYFYLLNSVILDIDNRLLLLINRWVHVFLEMFCFWLIFCIPLNLCFFLRRTRWHIVYEKLFHTIWDFVIRTEGYAWKLVFIKKEFFFLQLRMQMKGTWGLLRIWVVLNHSLIEKAVLVADFNILDVHWLCWCINIRYNIAVYLVKLD